MKNKQKMKILIKFFLISFIIISNNYCIPLIEENIGQVVEKKKFNLIGILGKDSVDNYIELFYSEANPNGNNNSIVHKWVKPPVIIGGHYSNITYNLIKNNSISALKYEKRPFINYNEGSSHFMKIINHGGNQIEYFIAGTQEVQNIDINTMFPSSISGNKNKSNAGIPTTLDYIRYPQVIYKNASIYFLLNPSEKPKTNQYILDYQIISTFPYTYYELLGYQTIYFENNKIGDIIVDKPWTIEDVMGLYRTEFSNGKTLILYYYSIIPGVKEEEYIKYIATLPQKYYGFINSGSSIISSDLNPLITTDRLFIY